MPYRLKKGQKISIGTDDGGVIERTLTRTIEFTKKEIIRSPLTEHHNEGIPGKHNTTHGIFRWGFDISEKWEDGGNCIRLYAEEAHYVSSTTSRDTKTVVVEGSKSNQYTLTLDDGDYAINCSCPAFRFKRKRKLPSTVAGECKHMEEWNTDNSRSILGVR
jgi:hypothetical protein